MVEVLFRGPRQPSGIELALSQAGLGFGQGLGEGIQQQQLIQQRQGFLDSLVPQAQNPFQIAADAVGPSLLTDPNAPQIGQLGQQVQQAQQQADPRQAVLAAIQANPGILADENAFNQILAQLQPPEAAEEPQRIQELRAIGIDPSSPEGQEALLRSRNALAEEPELDPITKNLQLADQARAEGRPRAAELFERRAEKEAGKSIDQIRAEAFAQAQGRLSAEQQFAPPEGTRVPNFLDDTGRVTRAATGEVRRQIGQLFGGRFDAATQTMQGLNREQALKSQEIATLAEQILQTGQVSGISEAVALATRGVQLPDVETSFADLGNELIRLAEEEEAGQPGEAALGQAEQRLSELMNVADATGIGSGVVSFLNNTVGQIAPSVVDRDVVRGRQRLALLQGDFINAFNRNPRLPVWEQQRLSNIFGGPELLSSPEAVREALAEMDRGLTREIEFRKKLLDAEQVPVDAKQEALETLQNLAQFRRRVREFDVRPSDQAAAEREAAERAARPPQVQRAEEQRQSGDVRQSGPGEVRMTVPEVPERQRDRPHMPGSDAPGQAQASPVPQRLTVDTLPSIDPRQLTPQQQRDLERRLEAEFLPQAQAGQLSPEAIRELRRIFSQIPPAPSE